MPDTGVTSTMLCEKSCDFLFFLVTGPVTMINTEKKKKALNYKGSVIGKMSVLFVHMRMIELRVCVAYLQADSHST